MKPSLLIHSLCVISSASLLIVPVVQAKEAAQTLPSTATTKLRGLKQPAKTLKEWMAQVEAAAVTVIDVKLERTTAGLDITLETANGKPLQVDATKFRVEGNSLIADIPKAVLSLPAAQSFSEANPTGDIANVQVTQVDVTSIRVNVVGKMHCPNQR